MRVEFDRRAVRDLRRLSRRAQNRIEEALRRTLGEARTPANADIKPLKGAAPWLRLRIGDYRVMYRPTSQKRDQEGHGYLVARIVHRRDLDKATDSLKL